MCWTSSDEWTPPDDGPLMSHPGSSHGYAVPVILRQQRAQGLGPFVPTRFHLFGISVVNRLDVSRLHKTNRQDVKELICSICVMLMNEMDSRLEAAGLGSWTDVMHTFDGCNVMYDRQNNTILFQGDEDVVTRALDVMDVLGIEHRLILGH